MGASTNHHRFNLNTEAARAKIVTLQKSNPAQPSAEITKEIDSALEKLAGHEVNHQS